MNTFSICFIEAMHLNAIYLGNNSLISQSTLINLINYIIKLIRRQLVDVLLQDASIVFLNGD